MDTEEKSIKILLISDNSEDAEKIKKNLKSNMRLPWNLRHCINVHEALTHIGNTDVIILELLLQEQSYPKQIFKDVGDMAFEIPIIALIGDSKDKHSLATYVMEKGAADIIVRGKFGRLVDAIEFALIRQNITTTTRSSSEKRMLNNKSQHTKEMKEINRARTNEQEKSRQILRMFTGDYSVDNNKENQT